MLTIDYGRLPYIALVLAFSFGTYGLLKKTANVGALESLAVETTVVAPVAAVYLGWLIASGASSFGMEGSGHALLLASTGIVTAIPLICFGAAAIRVPDHDARTAPVPRAGPAVRPRCLRARRGHADLALDRLRAGLGRPGRLHDRGDHAPPSPAAAHGPRLCRGLETGVRRPSDDGSEGGQDSIRTEDPHGPTDRAASAGYALKR